MNFAEVLDLHRAVAAFHARNIKQTLKIGVFNLQSRDQGYVLCIKAKPENSDLQKFLERMAVERKLELRRFKGYLLVHSYGDWSLFDY
jgi:hypothetical protein